MTHFADKLHIDKQTIERVEGVVLFFLIGGGLASMISAMCFRCGRG